MVYIDIGLKEEATIESCMSWSVLMNCALKLCCKLPCAKALA